MNQRFAYVGCFVKYNDFHNAIDAIRENPLENDIQDPHITFEYRPQEVNQSMFGEEVQISIVGYGNDGVNEGLKVRLSSNNNIVQSMIEKIEIPHITIAVSEEGKAVNTKNLIFEEIKPIELTGKYGGYTKRGKVMMIKKFDLEEEAK